MISFGIVTQRFGVWLPQLGQDHADALTLFPQ
jgi:hypothetical protein